MCFACSCWCQIHSLSLQGCLLKQSTIPHTAYHHPIPRRRPAQERGPLHPAEAHCPGLLPGREVEGAQIAREPGHPAGVRGGAGRAPGAQEPRVAAHELPGSVGGDQVKARQGKGGGGTCTKAIEGDQKEKAKKERNWTGGWGCRLLVWSFLLFSHLRKGVATLI